MTRLEVLFEQQQDQIRLLGEAVTGLDQKIDALREHMNARFREIMELIETSNRDIHRRISDLEARVQRLEASSSN